MKKTLKELLSELFEYSRYKGLKDEDISKYETIEDLVSRCNDPILIQRVASVLKVDKMKIISSIARCVYESINRLSYINESNSYKYEMKKIVIELINCENEITDFNKILYIIDENKKYANLASKVAGSFGGYDDKFLMGAIKMNYEDYLVYKQMYDNTPNRIATFLSYSAYESIYRIIELNKDNLDYSVSIDISVLLASKAVYYAFLLEYQHEFFDITSSLDREQLARKSRNFNPRSCIDPLIHEQIAQKHFNENLLKCAEILRERLGSDIIYKVNELLNN